MDIIELISQSGRKQHKTAIKHRENIARSPLSARQTHSPNIPEVVQEEHLPAAEGTSPDFKQIGFEM